jgi:hypothetical protein
VSDVHGDGAAGGGGGNYQTQLLAHGQHVE